MASKGTRSLASPCEASLGIGFDDRGKVKLSMKRVNQETGENIEDKKED